MPKKKKRTKYTDWKDVLNSYIMPTESHLDCLNRMRCELGSYVKVADKIGVDKRAIYNHVEKIRSGGFDTPNKPNHGLSDGFYYTLRLWLKHNGINMTKSEFDEFLKTEEAKTIIRTRILFGGFDYE